eukprot:1646676-Rhodomonas_salina.2
MLCSTAAEFPGTDAANGGTNQDDNRLTLLHPNVLYELQNLQVLRCCRYKAPYVPTQCLRRCAVLRDCMLVPETGADNARWEPTHPRASDAGQSVNCALSTVYFLRLCTVQKQCVKPHAAEFKLRLLFVFFFTPREVPENCGVKLRYDASCDLGRLSVFKALLAVPEQWGFKLRHGVDCRGP